MTIKFRINLEALYNKVGTNLKYGTYIRKQNRFGNEQYTLLEAPPECNPKGILLRDKEECVLLRAIDNQVLLKCEGRNQTFCLTPQEFEIASFVCDEQEIIAEKATAFCNDVALHFAYKLTLLHAGRILVDDGKHARLYESSMSFLASHEEKLIEHYATLGVDWNDVVEFIHTSILKDKIEGIRHAHFPNGDNYWSVTYSVDKASFWLGRYDCIIDAILAKRSFVNMISAFDATTTRGMNQIGLIAEEMVQTSLSASTKTMTPEEISSKLLQCSYLEAKEFEAYCKEASSLILSQQETIQNFIAANEILQNNPLYQKHLDLWRRETGRDDLSYPSGDQIYKDWWDLMNRKEPQ